MWTDRTVLGLRLSLTWGARVSEVTPGAQTHKACSVIGVQFYPSLEVTLRLKSMLLKVFGPTDKGG